MSATVETATDTERTAQEPPLGWRSLDEKPTWLRLTEGIDEHGAIHRLDCHLRWGDGGPDWLWVGHPDPNARALGWRHSDGLPEDWKPTEAMVRGTEPLPLELVRSRP